MNASIRIILGLSAYLFSGLVTAEIVQYHPNSPLYIGGNYDPSFPGRAFPQCLERTTVRGESLLPGQLPGTASSTEFFIKKISSRKELYRILNVSLSLSGSYGLFSGDFSGSLEQENTFDESTYTWIIHGYSNFGRFILESVRLTPEARALTNNPISFRNRCGTDYAAVEVRAVQAAAVFSIHNLSQSERRVLEASFSASYGAGGPLSIGGDAKYREFIKTAASYGQIQVSIFAIGGPGVAALSPIITNVDKPDVVLKTIQDYFASLTLDRSVAVSYNTGSLQGLISRANIETDVYNKFIADSFLHHSELAAEQARLTRIFNAKDDLGLTAADSSSLAAHINSLIKSKDQTLAAALRCKDSFNNVYDSPKNRRTACTAAPNAFAPIARKFTNLSPLPYYLRYFVSNELIPGQEVLNFSVRGLKLKEVKLVKQLSISAQTFTPITPVQIQTSPDGSRFAGTSVIMKDIALADLPIGLRIETDSGAIFFEQFTFTPAAAATLMTAPTTNSTTPKIPKATPAHFEKAHKGGELLPAAWKERD